MNFPVSNAHAVRLAIALFAAALAACTGSNDPITGRVSVTMGSHEVVVTGCHVQSVPAVKEDDATKTYRFSVCDHTIVIQDDTVFLDGESYGKAAEGDSVLIENGRASLHPR